MGRTVRCRQTACDHELLLHDHLPPLINTKRSFFFVQIGASTWGWRFKHKRKEVQEAGKTRERASCWGP